MACDKLGTKLTDYHFGELGASERPGVESHLAGCAECRRELEALGSTVEAVRESLVAAPATALSAEHRQRIRQAADAHARASAVEAPGLLARFRPWTFALGFSAAAAALLVFTISTETGAPAGSPFAIHRSSDYQRTAPAPAAPVAEPAPPATPDVPAPVQARPAPPADAMAPAPAPAPTAAPAPKAAPAPAEVKAQLLTEVSRSVSLPLRTENSRLSDEQIDEYAKRVGSILGEEASAPGAGARPDAQARETDRFAEGAKDATSSRALGRGLALGGAAGGGGPSAAGAPAESKADLVKPYVGRLTRLAPPERRKLKESLQNFMIADSSRPEASQKSAPPAPEARRSTIVYDKRADQAPAAPLDGEDLSLDGGPDSGGGAATGQGAADLAFDDASAEEEPAPAEASKAPKDMFFDDHGINPFVDTAQDAQSTFGLDVDTASYTLARTYLRRGELPPYASVRVEEYLNFFDYEYAPPEDGAFALHMEAAPSPYRKNHLLLRVGVKAREVDLKTRRPSHLVFVVDTSGSMGQGNRIGLVKQALTLLVGQLQEGDRVGLVTFNTRAQELLQPVEASHAELLQNALARIRTSGSTNAGEGLRLGYAMAARAFAPSANNRVIICSDGVANTGVVQADAMLAAVKEHAAKGIYLTAVGFGMGNMNDALLERLADAGNGSYAYVDTLDEARRIFVENLASTLEVVAKDAKLQIEFNRATVKRYRLLGYENRDVADRDFRNDQVDAGELGAGHSATALYELELTDDVREDLGVVRLRYQSPRSAQVTETQQPIPVACVRPGFEKASTSYRLAAVVGQFGELLRRSVWSKDRSVEELLPHVDQLARELPRNGQVRELKELITRAFELDARR